MRKRKSSRNLYERGGVWWARAKIGGRDIRRSLFTSDREGATARRFEDTRTRAAARAAHEGFKPFNLHHLRHEYAIRYLEDGGSIYDLQKELGHSSVKTTEIYLAFLSEDQAEAAKGRKSGHADSGKAG